MEGVFGSAGYSWLWFKASYARMGWLCASDWTGGWRTLVRSLPRVGDEACRKPRQGRKGQPQSERRTEGRQALTEGVENPQSSSMVRGDFGKG